MNMRIAITAAISAGMVFASTACMTFVAGRKVSATGRVIVGHNEDDWPPLTVHHGMLPAREWPAGTFMPASAGCCAKIPQASRTLACYWGEVKFPEGDLNADTFLNEKGVIVVSDSGGSSTERMDDPTLLTEGGIKFNLRRAVGERAVNARDGVRIICELVEKYGYAPSARIYTVADKDEAWLVQVVHGRNYVAVRCPDDQITIMPNLYTVYNLDAFPEGDVIASPDLVENAKRKGFWDGKGKFNFAKAYQGSYRYGPEKAFEHPNNTGRFRQAIRVLTGREWPEGKPFPFSVKPSKAKFSVDDMKALLSAHNGPLKDGKHVLETWSICSSTTIESTVCEFSNSAKDTVYHLALGRGCEKPYLRLRPFSEPLPAEIDESATAEARLATHVLPSGKNATPGRECACTAADGCAADEYATRDIFTDGEFFVGCNYWAKNAGMYMWSQWRPDIADKELEALARYGTRVMRVFPLWSDFQPLTGDCFAGGNYRSYRFRDNKPLPNWAGVDDEMMKRFRIFCDMAKKHDIKLIVGIVTGWMSGRQFVPPVFEERNVLVDPEAIMWQTRFVKYFVQEMKDHPAIAAWDYGNECNCMGARGTAMFYNWMDHIGMAIRLADPSRPIVSGMHGLSTDERSSAPIRLNGELSDILCTHPYMFYVGGCGKEAFNTMRIALHPTAESVLYRDLGGKPCFVEEIGNLGTSCVSDERTAAGMRTTMFSAWANDLKGCLWWCNSDQEVLEFPPYSLTPNERELGMLRQDLTPKAIMLEMDAFQRFRASLPFRKLPKARTDAVIVVPEKESGWIPGFGAYILARQAGFNPMFAGAEGELPESKLYIVVSAERGEGYTYQAQKRFFQKAKEGATVLLVYSGNARYTHMREQAGMKIDYCCRASCEKSFALDAYPDRRITASDGTTCKMIAAEAEVLGRTASGEAIFTKFKNGKGTVLTCNAPIDRQAIARTDAFTGENIQPYYLVMREAAKIAGLKSVVEKGDCPWVGFTEHPAADGSTIVMAINFEPRAMECPVKINGKIGRVWRGEVKQGKIVLAPNEVALFEVK